MNGPSPANDPLARIARFPIVLALVGAAAYAIALLGFSSDISTQRISASDAVQMARTLVGGVVLILGGAAWIGALGVGRSEWRAPLVISAVGAAILPGAIWAAVAAVALIGWIEHMGRASDEASANPERDASA